VMAYAILQEGIVLCSKYYLTKESQKWFSSRVSTKAVSPRIKSSQLPPLP
jgi:hypothetical protein